MFVPKQWGQDDPSCEELLIRYKSIISSPQARASFADFLSRNKKSAEINSVKKNNPVG
jgi:hypothetical protein